MGRSGALALAENLKRNVGLEELGTLPWTSPIHSFYYALIYVSS